MYWLIEFVIYSSNLLKFTYAYLFINKVDPIKKIAFSSMLKSSLPRWLYAVSLYSKIDNHLKRVLMSCSLMILKITLHVPLRALLLSIVISNIFAIIMTFSPLGL